MIEILWLKSTDKKIGQFYAYTFLGQFLTIVWLFGFREMYGTQSLQARCFKSAYLTL